ncbi:MAG: alpha-mannosidase [Oscillospiraceae bacterium]
MIFAKERVEVIAAQLKKFAVVQKLPIELWQYREGQFFTPAEADAAPGGWEQFDTRRMHWYGPDKHYWFRAQVTVPESFAGKSLWLNIHTQLEGEWDARNPQFLLFMDGTPVQGIDINHSEVKLTDSAEVGKSYTIDLQAYSGIDHSEFRFLGELLEIAPEVMALYYDIQVQLWSLDRMDKNGKTRIQLETALNDTINLLDLRDVYSDGFFLSVESARAFIKKAVYEDLAGDNEVIASCIGHTHIDVAWWWTVEQTKEKTARSFATVLKLMEEYPDYKFQSSQPVLYTFLKARYPELYAQVKQRVAEKRWEAEGGMWLEADCNLTSGESLARQFLYGKRFFTEEFGVDSKLLWLPDVFGYSGALPQIMKLSGIDYFMTTKLSWNQFNKVPNDTFLWEGIDGSKILTHLITTLGVGQSAERFFTTYNGMLHPDAIMGGWERYQNKEMNNDILIAYGYGDGGGGPTREMLETGERMEAGIKGTPMVRQEFALDYFRELEARVKDSKRLHTWAGEFYFEYHRGTYTSMGRNKRGNRKSELALMDLELLSVLAEPTGIAYPAAELERLWKMVLLNQFHDILPGSSIKEVYEVTKRDYEEIAAATSAMIAERADALAKGDGVTVFNTLGMETDQIVALPAGVDSLDGMTSQKIGDTSYALAKALPAKGYRGFATSGTQSSLTSPFTVKEQSGGYAVTTPFYNVVIDGKGLIDSLFDRENGREVADTKNGKKLNQLRVYEDKPIYYDNWDIDIFYDEKGWNVDELTSMEWTADGPLLLELTVERPFVHSLLRQKIRFYAHSRRIDFDTWVDWKENQHLLKVHFPVDVHADEATFDIQFGNVTRKTHTNTSWDMARFESCAHKWVDVSEADYGVSLLNDCKYGHSINRGDIALTLIKSGIEPNPTTDQEEHLFTYALLPHGGTWRQADTQKEAAILNQPAFAVQGGAAGASYSLATVDSPAVALETVKRAESGDGVVLRFYESRGSRVNASVKLAERYGSCTPCDLLENPLEDANPPEEEAKLEGNTLSFTIHPYEIRSFLLK